MDCTGVERPGLPVRGTRRKPPNRLKSVGGLRPELRGVPVFQHVNARLQRMTAANPRDRIRHLQPLCCEGVRPEETGTSLRDEAPALPDDDGRNRCRILGVAAVGVLHPRLVDNLRSDRARQRPRA